MEDTLDQAYRYVFYNTRLVERNYRHLRTFIKKSDSNRFISFNDFVSALDSHCINFDINLIAKYAFKFGHHDAFRCAAPLVPDIHISHIKDARPEIVFMYPDLIYHMNISIIVKYMIKGSNLQFNIHALNSCHNSNIALEYLRLFDDSAIKADLDKCYAFSLKHIIRYNKLILLGYPVEKVLKIMRPLSRENIVILSQIYPLSQLGVVDLDYRYYVKPFNMNYEQIKSSFGGVLVELDEEHPLAVRITRLIKDFMNSYSIDLLKENSELIDYSSSVPLIKILECGDLLQGVVLSDQLELYKWLSDIFEREVVLCSAWKYSSMNIFMYILEKNWKPEYNQLYDFIDIEDSFLNDLNELYSQEEIYRGSTVLDCITRFPPLFYVINPKLLAKNSTRSDYQRLHLNTVFNFEDFNEFGGYNQGFVEYIKLFDMNEIIEKFEEPDYEFISACVKYYPEIIPHLDIDFAIRELVCEIRNGRVDRDVYQTIVNKFGIDRIALEYRNQFNEDPPR